jgi:tetratricopeptide (TPR) repeat protein
MPNLESWFRKLSPTPPNLSDAESFHLFALSKSLFQASHGQNLTWVRALTQTLETRTSCLQHILDTDALASTMGASIADIYGLLVEDALRSGRGREAMQAMESLADKTKLAAFHFLAAFAAFNLNELDRCINECEKVSEPFAPIHTLMGQALLESGKPESAIEALKVAIEVAPTDPLPLVQLTKAYLVCGLPQESMAAVNKCRKVVGNNIEVECLAVMGITAAKEKPLEFCERTLANITALLQGDPSDIDTFILGMELSSHLGLKTWANKLADILEIPEMADQLKITRKLSPILKRNGELNWMDVSRVILDKLINLNQRNIAGQVMQ